MLESGDRTVGIGEGGLEMGENVRRRRSARASVGNLGGGHRADSAVRILLWPRSNRVQMRCQVRSLQPAVSDSADRGGDAAGDGALEESPQRAGCQAEPSDFVGAPDAERPPATTTGMAVAAKDPPCADRFSLGVALVVAAQIAVANQRADHLAMRTRHQLEPLSHRVPFLVAATKPSLLAHVRTRLPRKSPFYRRGVDAGYD